jgi:hypothetical protein
MKYLVIVNGATNVLSGKLPDGVPRSFFSNDERFVQTKETLLDVRKKIPGCTLAYLEGTELTSVQEKEYTDLCDIFIQLHDDPEVFAAVSSSNKSLGECTTLKRALEYLDGGYDFIFKICARTVIDPTIFHVEDFNDPAKFYFRKFSIGLKTWYSSVFYVIGGEQLGLYKDVLRKTIDTIISGQICDVETNLCAHIPADICVYKEVMGATGKMGGCGTIFIH